MALQAELPPTIVEAALRVLNEPDPDLKASLTEAYASAWRSGAITSVAPAGGWDVPSRPARPDNRVRLVKPWEMPAAGRGGSRTNRIAMLHALVHIESWAVDLAWDAIARFADQPEGGAEEGGENAGKGAAESTTSSAPEASETRPTPMQARPEATSMSAQARPRAASTSAQAHPEMSETSAASTPAGSSSESLARTFSRPAFSYGLPRAFFDDFVTVADDEARHYRLLKLRLESHGSTYGDLPAHDGLWESAERTSKSLPARLAVEHCTHEARGLDRLPVTIARFRAGGDPESAKLMEDVIYAEEITHCAAGVRWIEHLFETAHRGPLPEPSSAPRLADSTWRAEARAHARVEEWFHSLVRAFFYGGLKPPFNDWAREKAGFEPSWYLPLAEDAPNAPKSRKPPGKTAVQDN